MQTIGIVGAGLSGAVVARELAKVGYNCDLIDERDHLAGNCHTRRDKGTGIMVHQYGPHIFHTDNKKVWEYVNCYTKMMPYINRVKAVSAGRVYSLPINLHTINQFFETALSPDEAKEFIKKLSRTDIRSPLTFEEQALRFVGNDLYQAFFRGYTIKQWGVEPSALPASILKRLPLRFNYNDNYFNHLYQGMPEHGYSEMVKNILSHPRIKVLLNQSFENIKKSYHHIIYTGPIDRYFNYQYGRLKYRTLDFERYESDGDFQGTAVMNYCDRDIPYTRIAEHKHFAPWEADAFKKTVYFKEYSRACKKDDIPFYPIRLIAEKKMLNEYVSKANNSPGVTFIGRLGTYSYLDMDTTIERALETAQTIIPLLPSGETIPAFIHSPL